MSWEAILQNGSLQARLHEAEVYGLTAGSVLPGRNTRRVWSQPGGLHRDILASVRHGNREHKLVANLLGTSASDWVDNQQQVEEILLDAEKYWTTHGQEGAKAYLYLQNQATGSATIVFDVMAGQLNIPAPYDYGMLMDDPPIYAEAEIDLFTFPFGRAPTTYITGSATLNNGGGVSGSAGQYQLSTIGGQVVTPAKVSYQSAAEDVIRRFLCGMKSRGDVANFLFALEAPTGTYTNDMGTATDYTVAAIAAAGVSTANVVVAGAHRGMVVRVTPDNTVRTNTPVLRWTINSNVSAFKGKYRVIVRIDNLSGSAPSSITNMSLTYGGDGTLIANTSATMALSARSNFLVDLGTMEIPEQRWPDDHVITSFVFELRISTAALGFSTDLDIDCVYLLPIVEAHADVTLSANSAAQDILIFDGLADDPQTYLVDSAEDIKSNITLTLRPDGKFNLPPKTTPILFPLVLRTDDLTDDGSHDLTDQGTFSVEYFELFSPFR